MVAQCQTVGYGMRIVLFVRGNVAQASDAAMANGITSFETFGTLDSVTRAYAPRNALPAIKAWFNKAVPPREPGALLSYSEE